LLIIFSFETLSTTPYARGFDGLNDHMEQWLVFQKKKMIGKNSMGKIMGELL
jgi:hypothetical protein